MPRHLESPAKPISLGIVFLVWAYSLVKSVSSNYKGGAASVVGAFLIGMGIYSATSILYLSKDLTTVEIFASHLAYIVFFIAGAALMYQGHRIHKTKRAYNKSLKSGTPKSGAP